MASILVFEILNSLLNVFGTGLMTLILFCLSLIFKASLSALLIIQFTQLSQKIVVKTHYGLNGEVRIFGMKNSIEVFSVTLRGT